MPVVAAPGGRRAALGVCVAAALLCTTLAGAEQEIRAEQKIGAPSAVPAPSAVDLAKAPRVGRTNANYASWTIDSSYNRGFVHIDFDNKNLLAAATSLAPSTIRFGGGGNDYLSYAPFSACNSSVDNDNFVCLNTSHWDSLYRMANGARHAAAGCAVTCADPGLHALQPQARPSSSASRTIWWPRASRRAATSGSRTRASR